MPTLHGVSSLSGARSSSPRELCPTGAAMGFVRLWLKRGAILEHTEQARSSLRMLIRDRLCRHLDADRRNDQAFLVQVMSWGLDRLRMKFPCAAPLLP